MNIFESISSAVNSVYSHKMRSVLTMLGIIIGIGSVIMITSVGDGVKNTIFSTLNSINSRVIQVMLESSGDWEDLLTYGDADAIRKINTVDKVTVGCEWWGLELENRVNETMTGSLFGTDENYTILEEVNIQYGRFLSETDIENHANVAVISPQTAFKVFGYVNCVGERLEMTSYNGKVDFTVIGVLEGSPIEGSVIDGMLNTPLTRSLAVVPYTTINDIFGYEDKLDYFGVTVIGDGSTADTAKSITGLLDVRHGTEDKYYAESMEGEFAMVDTVFSGVTAFVAFVAGISLFVGGVGVMNIMLVTVKERTREIGIRKSLGATNSNIQFQFMLEAVTLTLIGGFIGIVLGFILAGIASDIITSTVGMEVLPVLSRGNTIFAFVVSTLVGIIFGVYPAGRAAKLDPIEALRYE